MRFEMQYLSVSIHLFYKLLNKTRNSNDTRETVHETPGKLTELLTLTLRRQIPGVGNY